MKYKEYKFVDFNPSWKGEPPVRLSLVPYWFLAALRVVLTLLPQNGYVHPDEYFQSVEVVAGDVLDIDVSRPWEFNRTFPIRSITLPFLTVGLPLTFLRKFSSLVTEWFDINIQTPYTLLVTPRLAACLLSFVADYSLYRICCAYGQNYRTRLITLASSYVVLVYGTRTFSNMMEMVLLSLLLFLVADCMSFSDRVIHHDEFLSEKYRTARSPVERVNVFKMRSALPPHSLTHCVTVATITVAGIFNRPTFIAFAFPPIFFWLHRGLGSKTVGFKDFHLRSLTFILSGIPTVLLFIVVDSFYYGYLTNSEIQELKVTLNNFVVTPLNFIRYNINSKNLAQHGLHPCYLHFLVNVPLLYNVLGVVSIITFIKMIYRGACKQWSSLPRIQSIIGLMTASFITPIITLSMFPHQEARFLIPVTLPVVFLHAQRMQPSPEQPKKRKVIPGRGPAIGYLLTVWYLFNILLTVFYGFLHQGGVYPLMDHLSEEMQTKPRFTVLHVVTSHTYSLPLSLLQLHNSKHVVFNRRTGEKYQRARQFFTYEMGSKPLEEVCLKLEKLLEDCEEKSVSKKLDYRLYLVLPASLSEDFHNILYSSNATFSHSVSRVFYPHVSTEALPRFLGGAECFEDDLVGFCDSDRIYQSPLKYISRLMEQFGLILMRVTKRTHSRTRE
ncbi:GPI mannosyltransferase 4 [Anabrus simplex]|uniref:GPI mannosyltransferase 4 n=1 Tax=Anabrus simplex TaxID=316456 RepID=UPI0035A2BED2